MKADARYVVLGAVALSAVLVVAGCHGGRAAAGSGAPATKAAEGAANPAIQQWQQKFPGTAALMQSVTGVRILLQSNRHPLTSDQAVNLLPLLTPLPERASLPQDQALEVAQSIGGNLTPDQQVDIGLLRKNVRNRAGAGRKAGVTGGAGAAGRAGGMRWINLDMAPDENIFQSGPPRRMLSTEIAQLQLVAKG